MKGIPKLTYSQVPVYREVVLEHQGGVCAICGQPIPKGTDVLDHDHKDGHIRGVLHRGCNSLLGKLENNHKRYGVQDLRLFLAGVSSYLTRSSRIPLEDRVLHPTFKTDEEKREARREKARARRQAAKGGGA